MKLIIIGGALLALLSVGPLIVKTFNPNPVHTVTWFKDHAKERHAAMAWCRDNPGLRHPNCSAAADAELDVNIDAINRQAWGKK